MSPRPPATVPRPIAGPTVLVTTAGPHVALTVGDQTRRMPPGIARDLADQLHDAADTGVVTGRALRNSPPRLRARRLTEDLVRLDLAGLVLDVPLADALKFSDSIVDATEEPGP